MDHETTQTSHPAATALGTDTKVLMALMAYTLALVATGVGGGGPWWLAAHLSVTGLFAGIAMVRLLALRVG
ncbi:MAG: hypothetical protein OXF41_15670 [bacterium]|nr:hypothetical protein [bacterium]